MFNIGFGELAIICIVLIIAVGPERLPSMMKTVGKTMRTLRQASRDLRESTGIDELLREDFDYRPPLRPAAPPAGPPPVAREAEPALAESAVTPGEAPAETPSPDLAAAASLPSDAPIEDGAPAPQPEAPPATANLDHANVEGSLPSDAPLAAPEPGPAALAAAKPRES
jgi:sec-independent protein translocase protein TatB